MLLLITKRAQERAALRSRLLTEGMLVVLATPTTAMAAISRDRFDAVLIDVASCGKSAAALEAAIRHEGRAGLILALQTEEDAENFGVRAFPVSPRVRVSDIVHYLYIESGYTESYRATDRIAGIVRVKAEENRAYCALVPIDLTVSSRAMLSLLVVRYPQPIAHEDFMEICFRPLGILHPSIVSRTAKRINELFESYELDAPIAYERNTGYFLSYRPSE